MRALQSRRSRSGAPGAVGLEDGHSTVESMPSFGFRRAGDDKERRSTPIARLLIRMGARQARSRTLVALVALCVFTTWIVSLRSTGRLQLGSVRALGMGLPEIRPGEELPPPSVLEAHVCLSAEENHRCLESDAESKKRVTYKTLTAVQRSTRVVLAASLPPGTLTKPALARGEPWSGDCAVVGGSHQLLAGRGHGAAIDAHDVVLRVMHADSHTHQLSEHDGGGSTSLAVAAAAVAEACMAAGGDCAACFVYGAATPLMVDYGARLGGGSFREQRHVEDNDMQLSNGTATSAMSLASYKLLLPCMVARAMDDADAALFPAPVQLKALAARLAVAAERQVTARLFHEKMLQKMGGKKRRGRSATHGTRGTAAGGSQEEAAATTELAPDPNSLAGVPSFMLSPDGSRLLSGEERRRNRINLRAKRGMSHGPHAVYGLAAIRSQARRSFYTAAFGLSSFFFATPPPGAQAAVRTYEGTVRTGNVTGRGWGYKAHQKMFHGLAGPQHAPPASAAGVDAAGSSTHRGPKKGPGRHKDASKASAADTHGVAATVFEVLRAASDETRRQTMVFDTHHTDLLAVLTAALTCDSVTLYGIVPREHRLADYYLHFDRNVHAAFEFRKEEVFPPVSLTW